MGVSYLVGLLVTALPRARFAYATLAERARAHASWIALIAGLVLCLATFVHLDVFAVSALAANSVGYAVPIAFFGGDVRADPATANMVVVLAILECAALAAFATAIRFLERRVAIGAVAIVACALVVPAFASGAQDSPDPYLYVGQAMLGFAAYAPPANSFVAPFTVLNRMWGTPLLPSAYGPLWIGFTHAFLMLAPTLLGKLLLLRAMGLVAIAACAILTARLGCDRTIVAAIACNPALYDLFVAGAHNDLAGVALVVWSLVALRRRHVRLAVALAVGACLVKITLLAAVVTGAVFLPTIAARVRYVGVVAVLAVAAYAAGTLGHGFSALHAVALRYGAPRPLMTTVLKDALAAVTAGALVLAMLRGRTYGRAAWGYSALGVNPLGWYLAWSLPYALVSGEIAYAFLFTLPFAAYAQSAVYAETPFFAVVRGVVVFALIATLAWAYRPASARAKGSVRG